MPKVTILMTSYNHEKYISESIKSILDQTFADFELIIVDDCSTDSSFEIIKSFKDKRIKAIRNKRNMGPEHAFEILHRTAKSEYVAVADSDNVWKKEKLKKQVDFLDKHLEYAAVFTKVNLIDGVGRPYKNKKSVYYNVFNVRNKSRQAWLKHFFFHGNCLCHPSVLIRRQAYKNCQMVVNGLWQLPDLYKWIRLCLKEEIYVLEDRLVDFRLHENNISGENNLESILRRGNEVYQVYSLFYEMSKRDFLLIFGKDSQYVIDGEVNVNFALSKMMMEFGILALQTLGLNKIFEILNNDKERRQIMKLYGYDDVNYKKDETKYSPFALSSLEIHKAKLYLDLGNGFDEKDTLVSDFVISKTGDFYVCFEDIRKVVKGKTIKALRFDPCECCSKMIINEVNSDGKRLSFEVDRTNFLPGQYMRDGEYDVFFVNDPAYRLNEYGETPQKIVIAGKMVILTPADVATIKNLEIEEINESLPYVYRLLRNKRKKKS